ncbi:2920_t:CDS:2 [Entrophospora sp. SA101]|nr:2920_t:CDS:2 [Entrophospora sp. SA101]
MHKANNKVENETEQKEKSKEKERIGNNTTGAGGNGNSGGGGVSSSSSNNNNSASKNGNITNSTDALPKRLTKGKEPGKEVPVVILRRYKRIHKLKVRDYATKEELVAAVTRHYATQTVKEVDMIASFIYAVQNKDNTLKLPIP